MMRPPERSAEGASTAGETARPPAEKWTWSSHAT